MSDVMVKWGVGCTVFLIFSVVSSCQMTKQHIVNAIEHGASPLEARCALSSDGNGDRECIVLYAKEYAGG